ncbi:HmuY family protein [Sphingobacterium suaedae]|uniref:HmuY family protein n=1 Tax=Sphingobacterium suaedae TaxID=1686402 RepID=A0ABW5KCM1_9SPHI
MQITYPTPKNVLRIHLFALFISLGMISSCGKNEDTAPVIGPDPITSDTMFNRLITVHNFGEALADGSIPTDKQDPIFFSLEQKQAVKPDYQRTTRWDISFSDIYRSFINCNHSSAGFGNDGPGKGGIYLVKQKFEDVVNVPPDDVFRRGERAYGTDDSGAFGEGLGWYLYDFGGTLKGDGSEEKKHIAYPIENHTLLVRTAKGNYAKIKILSIYKDKLDPNTWVRSDPQPYYTFQYVLVKAGSTRFEIKP